MVNSVRTLSDESVIKRQYLGTFLLGQNALLRVSLGVLFISLFLQRLADLLRIVLAW